MTKPFSIADLPPLLVVTGKGGVGKTTVSAVLAHLSAGAGRRTLLVEIDPRENAHQMLGIPPSGGDVAKASERLWLQNVQPRDVLDRLVADKLRLSSLTRRVTTNPVYEQFVDGCPGLEEIAILGHALRCLKAEALAEKGIERVVLDAPASGHGVSLLAAPELVAETIPSGPIGRMASELAAFVREPDRCGIVAVTAAEEMPMDETLELLDILRDRLERRPELVVVNGLYPEVPADFESADAIDRLWEERRRVNDRELERLRDRWVGSTRELPRLALDRGPWLVRRLGTVLTGSREGGLE